MLRIKILFLFSAFVPLATTLFAQDPNLPITLESPQQAMRVHLNYLQPDSYEPRKAARALARVQDTISPTQAAIQLKQILDATTFVRIGSIPDNPDYIDSTSNEAIYVPFPLELPEVYLEKENGRWYYSSETVQQIPRLHSKLFPFGSEFLVSLFPQIGQKKILGLAVWQYLGLLIMLGAGVVLFLAVNFLMKPLIRRLGKFKRYPDLIPVPKLNKIARYASILLILRFFKYVQPSLLLPPKAADFTNKTIWLISTFFILMILLKVLDIVMIYARKVTAKTESTLDEELLPIFRTLGQVLIVGAVLIQVFRMFDIDITAIIAGLSIGGLALALAAKDTAQNLFGSVTLFLDRPFQVGDWINFEDVDGTVEVIGIRATRIRTFANSLVYVPNGKLATIHINNYGLRHYRRFNTYISLTYDTPPDLIDKYVEGLKGIVAYHPRTRKDFYEIHLNQFNSSSLDILFYIFFDVPTWSDELKARQEIMLAAIRLARNLGIRFAFPSSSLYVEQFPGQPSMLPDYSQAEGSPDEKIQHFLEQFKSDFRNGNQ